MAHVDHLPRVCHVGLSGPDVLAYSDVYRRKGIRKRPRTHNFGVHMHDNTVAFQKKAGLRADGVVGTKTFEAMRPFTSYEQWLLNKAESKYDASPRDLIVGAALAAYKTRPFTYEQVRPYPPTLAALIRDGSDCSGSSEVFYKTAHLHDSSVPDPSNFGFNGSGNTNTMLANGHRIDTPAKADLVFYYWDYGHVGVYLGAGRVFSHGHPGGPTIISTAGATMYRTYL